MADELWKHSPGETMLFLSEEDYDSPFSAQRALSRNRCIHTLGRMVFVAQSGMEKGGTWDGTAKNLQFGWSPVAYYTCYYGKCIFSFWCFTPTVQPYSL
ncbi:MAG: hypothetical protein IIW09_00420 [Acetobacter sp.]|nr:hypothetical protein [Acetobacter sp.]